MPFPHVQSEAAKQMKSNDASAKEVKQVKMRSAIEEVENDIFVFVFLVVRSCFLFFLLSCVDTT